MGQEYFINSQELENKIRQLLPSQGGAGAGFDLSASTQIIPIIDVTESAEGSNVRADLQTAFSFTNTNFNAFANSTITIINNTGYHRIFGSYNTTGATACIFALTDGATTKTLAQFQGYASENGVFDFVVFVKAGESVTCQSNGATTSVFVATRQVADIDGNLISPT